MQIVYIMHKLFFK